MHVAFNVARTDMEVSHIAAMSDDAASVTVADVAAGDVALMQIYMVIKHTDPGVIIDVAIADNNVPIMPHEMDSMSTITDGCPGDRDLHRARDFDSDRKSTRLNSSHLARSRMPSSA